VSRMERQCAIVDASTHRTRDCHQLHMRSRRLPL
jgi:hypothetical protein